MSALLRWLVLALSTLVLVGDASLGDPKTSEITPRPPKIDADIQAVLEAYDALGARPFETLPPELARRQPTLADAVEVVLTRQLQAEPAPEPVAKVVDRTYGPHDLPVRIYTPAGSRPFPVIVYFHDGGWVMGDLDRYDATPRALANAAGAIVVAASYRQGPEHKFPAAHDDAIDAYHWALDNAAKLGGSPRRIAVAGEGAGANLALNVAIRARDDKLTTPRHMLLVCPIAGGNVETPSYIRNANARPLSKAGMLWFFKHELNDPAELKDPRIDLVARKDLAGLPSATVITAQVDPLRSEGLMLVRRLDRAGVTVYDADYLGATHEFFGMAAVVSDAKHAQKRAGMLLKAAFRGRGASPGPPNMSTP